MSNKISFYILLLFFSLLKLTTTINNSYRAINQQILDKTNKNKLNYNANSNSPSFIQKNAIENGETDQLMTKFLQNLGKKGRKELLSEVTSDHVKLKENFKNASKKLNEIFSNTENSTAGVKKNSRVNKQVDYKDAENIFKKLQSTRNKINHITKKIHTPGYSKVESGTKNKENIPKQIIYYKNKPAIVIHKTNINKTSKKIKNRRKKNRAAKPSIVIKQKKGKKIQKDDDEDLFSSFKSSLNKSRKLSKSIENLSNHIEKKKKTNSHYENVFEKKENEVQKKLKTNTIKKPEKISPKELLKIIHNSFKKNSIPNIVAKEVKDNESQESKNLQKIQNKMNDLDSKVNKKKVPKKKEFKISKILKKMKKSNLILQKPKSRTFERGDNLYKTQNDINKDIFTIIRSTFEYILREFIQLDKINEKLYDCSNNLLNKQGLIRISKKNLGKIVKNAFIINQNFRLNFEAKINKLYDFTYKSLIEQNRKNQLNPKNELIRITRNDMNRIISYVADTNDINFSPIPQNDLIKVKPLIYEIMQNLPLVIISTKREHKSKIKNNDIFKIDNSIINEEKMKKLTKKLKIIKISLKKLMQKKAPQGQGRKSITNKGFIERTEIFDITNWPESCKTNKNQSPININHPYSPFTVGLTLKYRKPRGKITFRNDGLKLILRGNFGNIYFGIHEYTAREIHFHLPSEHTFGNDERRSPMEIQIIHQDIFGNLAGVAVLFEIGKKDNEFLKYIGFGNENPMWAMKLRNSEIINVKNSDALDLGKYLNKIDHFVSYEGSITSPPCNPNVKWFVLLQKLRISEKQIEYFPVLSGMNSNIRGLQDLEKRTLEIM